MILNFVGKALKIKHVSKEVNFLTRNDTRKYKLNKDNDVLHLVPVRVNRHQIKMLCQILVNYFPVNQWTIQIFINPYREVMFMIKCCYKYIYNHLLNVSTFLSNSHRKELVHMFVHEINAQFHYTTDFHTT